MSNEIEMNKEDKHESLNSPSKNKTDAELERKYLIEKLEKRHRYRKLVLFLLFLIQLLVISIGIFISRNIESDTLRTIYYVAAGIMLLPAFLSVFKFRSENDYSNLIKETLTSNKDLVDKITKEVLRKVYH